MKRRRTDEDWRRILVEQKEQGLSDQACCTLHGIGISSLRRWRGRLGLGRSRGHSAFVELSSPPPGGMLRIILPNKVELIVSRDWSADQVASLARGLAVL